MFYHLVILLKLKLLGIFVINMPEVESDLCIVCPVAVEPGGGLGLEASTDVSWPRPLSAQVGDVGGVVLLGLLLPRLLVFTGGLGLGAHQERR